MVRHQCPHPYHQTQRRRLIEKTALFIVIVLLVLFFVLGRLSVKDVKQYQADNARLKESVVKLTKANKALVKRLDFIESSKVIDAQSQKDARKSLVKLHEELSDTKEQLVFYQRVVAPETLIKGLYIDSFDIRPLDEKGGYDYELVLAQGTSQKQVIKGQYTFSIVGDWQGEEKEFLLEDLSIEGLKSGNFSFRYYELLTGEIKLPIGFIPKTVSMIINRSKKGSKPMQEQWLWREVVSG